MNLADMLPHDGVGCPVAPGMHVFTTYQGERWEAQVTCVRRSSIDVQYTNDAGHRAKGCTARRQIPDEWIVFEPKTP